MHFHGFWPWPVPARGSWRQRLRSPEIWEGSAPPVVWESQLGNSCGTSLSDRGDRGQLSQVQSVGSVVLLIPYRLPTSCCVNLAVSLWQVQRILVLCTQRGCGPPFDSCLHIWDSCTGQSGSSDVPSTLQSRFIFPIARMLRKDSEG